MLISIIRILQLLALFYPVSVSALVQMRRPIALVVPNILMIRQIINCLNAENSLITEDMSISDTKSRLKLSAITPIVYISRNTDTVSKKVEKQWRLVYNAVTLSEVDGEPVNTQIIFLYEDCIPKMYADNFFKIFIDEEESLEQWFGIDFSKYEDVCLNERMIKKVCANNKEYGYELCAFFSAIDFATEFDETIGAEEKELKQTAELLVTYDDEDESDGDVLRRFKNLLYSLAEDLRFSDVYQLPNLESDVIQRLDEVILYDGVYIAMTSKLYNRVTQNLENSFSRNKIKRMLVEGGVLVGGRNRYASKIQYTNAYGATVRPCVLRFLREKINKVGEMDFIDLCISNKEETV